MVEQIDHRPTRHHRPPHCHPLALGRERGWGGRRAPGWRLKVPRPLDPVEAGERSWIEQTPGAMESLQEIHPHTLDPEGERSG